MSAVSLPKLVLLGTPHLRAGETRFDLPDALPGYLVAFLAARGDWVLREQLAALLWPDAAEEEAQHNLRVNLSRLRPHLERWGIASAFAAERRRLRLAVDTDAVAVRAAHARGDWPTVCAAVDGLFLEGLSLRAFPVLAEWARAERDALKALWREALLRGAAAFDAQAAAGLTSRYLAAEPLDEEVLRVKLQALVRLGHLDEVRRLYDDFDALSRRELGVQASAALATSVRRWVEAAGAATPVVSDDDPLIGREAELTEIGRRVEREPLTTLVGLGGIGKTRLARAVQAQLAPRFGPDAVWLSLIDLAGVAEIPSRLADAMQVTLAGTRDALDQIAEAIGQRDFLLVLDNAEHLLGERSALNVLLTRLLRDGTGLHCVVTSREPLQHPRERVFRLEGLAVPPPGAGAAALSAPAVRLFVHHARRVRPALDPRPVADDLAQIARLAGGLPLALRIAAVWLRFLSCADVAAELRRGLDSLEPSAKESLGLRASLARTWQRLTAVEQGALARLAVFAGPFSVQAAREVAAAALPVMASLVEHGLLMPSGVVELGRSRFELHPLVRAFALERLAEDADGQARAFERHAVHFARLLAPWSSFRTVDQKQALSVIGHSLEEALAAWRWAMGAGRADLIIDLSTPLQVYLEQKGCWNEGIALFGAAIGSLDPSDPRELAALAQLARCESTLLYRKTDADAAEASARRALVWSRATGHRDGIAASLNTLALSLWLQNRFDEAYPNAEEARQLARADGNDIGEALYAGTVALLDKATGRYDAAIAIWRRVLTLHRTAGNQRSVVNVLHNLGGVLTHLRRFDEAQECLEEGLRLCDEHGFVATRAFLLQNLALLHLRAGRMERAESFAATAIAEVQRTGDRKIEAAVRVALALARLHAADLGAAAEQIRQALQLGRATGVVTNQLEALNAYAQWLHACGDTVAAVRVEDTLLAHPALHRELRDRIAQARDGRHDPRADPPAHAAIVDRDFVLLCEDALRELGEAVPQASAPPSRPMP